MLHTSVRSTRPRFFTMQNIETRELVHFSTAQREFRHWNLKVQGRIATLAMNVDEDGGLRPGYKLKLNSYDLGVDIELHNALQRIRFEHPEVACVIITSAKDRMFCAGANIYMLASSSHAWKVNFCKFTNETRNGMEDSSRHDGLKFLAAVKGIELRPLSRKIDDSGYHYSQVDVLFDREARTATITIRGPRGAQPETIGAIHAAGDSWWPLAMARELDDAILMLRANEPELGLFLLKTEGEIPPVLQVDTVLANSREDWVVRETVGLLRRTLARLDVSSRSMFAIIEKGSCFAGTLLELALAADRSYMRALPEAEIAATSGVKNNAASGTGEEAPKIALSAVNFGIFPVVHGRSRLETRFRGDLQKLAKLRAKAGAALRADDAIELGLVTVAPDDLDWEDELRLAIEERTSLSPDALTGMEASLRFPGAETTDTKIFGRPSAWQNWIFIRPNATGEQGALKLFGKGSKAKFDRERV